MLESQKSLTPDLQVTTVLGIKKTCSVIWDVLSLELSSTVFTVGNFLQDQAPLSTQALKYLYTENLSHRKVMY